MSVAINKSQPLVSIIVPTYNRANYLCETLRSALAQSYQNIEVLVFDDASPDNTSEVVAELFTDPRLIYVRHSKNLGINRNWKAGIEAVTGEFFCILNDDDTLDPEFIESLLDPLINNEDLILSTCDHWMVDVDGLRLDKESEEASQRFKRNELHQGCLQDFVYEAAVNQSIFIGTTLFRRSLVSPEFLHEKSQCSVDVWLLYQCARTGYGAYYTPKRLLNYRLHDNAMTWQRKWRRCITEGDLFRYEQILNDPKMSHLHPLIQPKLADTLSLHGINLLAAGEQQQAHQVLKKAWQLKRSTKTLLAYGLASLGSLGTTTLVTLQNLQASMRKARLTP